MEGEVLSLAALHIISVFNVSGVTYTIMHCVTKLFYRLFYHMEQLDLLNPVNEVHILHYIMCTFLA